MCELPADFKLVLSGSSLSLIGLSDRYAYKMMLPQVTDRLNPTRGAALAAERELYRETSKLLESFTPHLVRFEQVSQCTLQDLLEAVDRSGQLGFLKRQFLKFGYDQLDPRYERIQEVDEDVGEWLFDLLVAMYAGDLEAIETLRHDEKIHKLAALDPELWKEVITYNLDPSDQIASLQAADQELGNAVHALQVYPKSQTLQQLSNVLDAREREGIPNRRAYYFAASQLQNNIAAYEFPLPVTSPLIVLRTERIHGPSLFDYIQQGKGNVKQLVFQVIWTLFVFSRLGIRHGDLHTANVLVDLKPADPTAAYQFGNGFFQVDSPVSAKIFDWDFGSILEPSFGQPELPAIPNPWAQGLCNYTSACGPNSKADLYSFLETIDWSRITDPDLLSLRAAIMHPKLQSFDWSKHHGYQARLCKGPLKETISDGTCHLEETDQSCQGPWEPLSPCLLSPEEILQTRFREWWHPSGQVPIPPVYKEP